MSRDWTEPVQQSSLNTDLDDLSKESKNKLSSSNENTKTLTNAFENSSKLKTYSPLKVDGCAPTTDGNIFEDNSNIITNFKSYSNNRDYKTNNSDDPLQNSKHRLHDQSNFVENRPGPITNSTICSQNFRDGIDKQSIRLDIEEYCKEDSINRIDRSDVLNNSYDQMGNSEILHSPDDSRQEVSNNSFNNYKSEISNNYLNSTNDRTDFLTTRSNCENSSNRSDNNRVSFQLGDRILNMKTVDNLRITTDESSNSFTVPPRRPDSLPLGDPPSYSEALSYSPIMYSLPCEFPLRKSRSMFSLDSTPFNGLVDENFLENPKTTPRLIALPDVHSLRRAKSTPGVSYADVITKETVVPARDGFADYPCSCYCTECKITVLTTVSSTYKSTTYCCCFLMFFSGVCCPLSFVPFMLCGPREIYHCCPQCKNVLGVHLSN